MAFATKLNGEVHYNKYFKIKAINEIKKGKKTEKDSDLHIVVLKNTDC